MARPLGLAPAAVTIGGLVRSVLERCTHPPSNIEELADWLYWLPWAADTTLRRPDGTEAEWPIRHQVPYTAALARRFAADPVGEWSGAVRAATIGRWPPEEHGAWLTRCRRLARAITTGQGVSAASREWWNHLQGLASQPIVQTSDREHHSTRSEILGPQNRATRPRSELTRVGTGQMLASGELPASCRQPGSDSHGGGVGGGWPTSEELAIVRPRLERMVEERRAEGLPELGPTTLLEIAWSMVEKERHR